MTVLEKVRACADNFDCEKDNAEKLIALAYFIGREEAAKEISDKCNTLLREQRDRADKCRYRNLAHKVIGNIKHIYSPDYAQSMTEMFGSDITDI